MRVQVEELEEQKKLQKVNIDSLSGELRKVKKNLRVLQSKKRRTNAAKRNLLIYYALNKNRRQEIESRSEASSCDSEQSLIQDYQQMKEKVKDLYQTIRNQRHQIHELNQQIEDLKDQEYEHQTLQQEFQRFDRYVRGITKKNKKLKEKW